MTRMAVAPIPANIVTLPAVEARLFQCPVCPSSFKRPEHLKRHQRSHEQSRRFVCAICDKKFTRRYAPLDAPDLHGNEPGAGLNSLVNHRGNHLVTFWPSIRRSILIQPVLRSCGRQRTARTLGNDDEPVMSARESGRNVQKANLARDAVYAVCSASTRSHAFR
jgi:hypothetical protein